MSQHDLDLADAAGAAFRADANNALQALGTLQSGSSAPSTTYARMLWADTTDNLLKQRNAANSAWIVRGSLDESFVLSRSSNTILGVADRGKTLIATAGFTQTLTAAATLGDGWFIDLIVDSGATLVIDPNSTEQVDGATTKSIVGPAQGRLVCNGTLFRTIGFSSGGSGLVLIQQQTAANAASVDFTTGIDSTYDTYLLTLADVVPQTDNTDLYLRVSVDGGANWLAGTTYAYENITGNGGSASVSASTGTAQLLLSNALGNATGEVWNGSLCIQNPSNAVVYKSIHGTSVYLNSAAAVTSRAIGCIAKTTSAINGIRLLMSSGNINGKFALYGVKKS